MLDVAYAIIIRRSFQFLYEKIILHNISKNALHNKLLHY